MVRRCTVPYSQDTNSDQLARAEQWKLVREALRERKIFLETAPHLSSMLP